MQITFELLQVFMHIIIRKIDYNARTHMNILLLPTGKRSYLIEFFQKALGGRGEIHASNTELSPALFAADKYFLTPPMHTSDYKDVILQYCIENAINAVIPLSDLNLSALSRAKSEFRKHGITIIVAEPEIIDICNDKWQTYLYMKSKDINTPETFLTKHAFLQSVSKGKSNYPVIVKPRFGVGTLGVFEAENEAEIDLYFMVSEKLLRKSYLKYFIPDGLERPIILQEKIAGQEYTIDVINDLHGNYKTTFIKNKLGALNGEANPVVFEDVACIQEIGRQIGETIKHVGVCNVDCMYTEERVFVLDLNPRFGGCYPYSQLAGADIPHAIVSWMQDEEPRASDLTVHVGTYCYKDNVAKIGRRE